MKIRNLATGLAAVLLAGGLAGTAAAHGTRTHTSVGLYVGAPVYWGSPYWGPGPYWYPSPYYPPPVVVVQPPQPQIYTEQSEPAREAAPAQSYWHYCQSAKGYYPYVKECPEGWRKVLPQPEK